MAAVLDALAPYVKKLLMEMAEEKVSMLLGVSDEITKLEDNMENIKAFLADAERRRLTDLTVQRWVRKLKGAMYDATDIIDLCHLEADKRRGSTADGSSSVKEKVPAGCFQPLLFCMRNPVFAHKIGSQIKELNQRLDDLHKEGDRFKFNIGLGSNPEPRILTDAERSMQKMTSEFNESAIVGDKIEQDTRELAQLLITSGSHDIKLVSIVGTGGMGKTTLGQKIFNDTSVQEHFKVKVWLSITQHLDDVELLRTAIEQAGGRHGGTQDKTLLTRTLTDRLSTGRFLLVLDDMWSEQAWSRVLSVPIRNASQKQPGNWVLVTSRLEDLALRMGASFYQHHVSPLNEEDAWSLLNKQLPLQPNQLPSLKMLHIKDAPAIKRVGFEFQASSSLTAVGGGGTETTSAAFPNLRHLILQGLCEWEEWDWVEQATVDVTAGTMDMPALEGLTIRNCNLSCLPPGLANSQRHALRELYVQELPNLTSVDNFPSVVDLDVFDCPKLKRISGLFRLHKIRIIRCPNMEVLEGVPALDSLRLNDATMETLPAYLPRVNPRYLSLSCNKKLYESLSSPGSSELNKISHIEKRDISYYE